MMHFMNVFVKKLCVQESMNVVEGDIVCYVIGDNLADKLRKAWNGPSIVRHNVTRVMFNYIHNRRQEDWPNHVDIYQDNPQHLWEIIDGLIF